MRSLLMIVLLAALSTWSMSVRGAQSLPGSDLPIREEEAPPAEEPKPEGPSVEEAPEAPKPEVTRPAPYSLPWHLRAAVPASTVRLDNTIAFQDTAHTVVTFVSASWRFVPDAMLGVRYGWVVDAPDREAQRTAFTNVGLSATYAPVLARVFRLALSGGVALPFGQGGGDVPNAGNQKAIASGVYTRSAMDNAMFAPNDLGIFAGAALAYIESGVTLQLEATFFNLLRVDGVSNQPDENKTNTTWGAHAGYFVLPELSVGAELRYQDFLVPPKAVTKAPARRDSATFEIGARAHFKLGTHALRPGVAYAHPIDDPMAAAGYRIVQIDIPFVF